MAKKKSSIVYNFEPDFPDSAVERYPSLTCALGNFYPGVRTSAGPVDEDEEVHASERVSDHDTSSPMSFDGTSSSGSEFIWPFEAAVPKVPKYTQDVVAGPSGDQGFWDGMTQSHDNSILGMNSFLRYRSQYLRHTPSEDAAEIPNGATFLDFPSFIPIRNRIPMGDFLGIKSEDDHSDAALNSLSWPPVPPGMVVTEASDSPSPRTKPRKTYRCSACPDSFIRLSDLREHEETHSSGQLVHHQSIILPKQRTASPAAKFVCDFPGCVKEFGVRSNLNRHQVSHGIKRRGRGRPAANPPYAVQFADPVLPPALVHSDTVAVPSPVAWDSDGPFAWRVPLCVEAAQNGDNNTRHM
ncbi:hypothetical protein B0H16DRAFT_1542951 [Mycena metata]|uniref:C2H2-type domain-containing protein n=1 Tax=Mycena metata TaxID=1033252 RepID=A0AAD7J2H6_9AGAR|nr:hypothetical protein B0H16DRAFT_1542951 [Mycena metata]